MDLSIIMPVYNVTDYIEESVRSVCTQKFQGSWELILVNDGTKDDSVQKAESVLSQYPDVTWKLANKENGGLPSARNFGFNMAQGKYVCFIDSDDMIAEDHCQSLFKLCEEENLNAAYSDYELTYLSNRGGTDNDNRGKELISRTDLLNGFLERKLKIHCCSLLLRTSYLRDNNYIFNESVKYGEDMQFMWRLFPNLDRIGHVKLYGYKYLQRPNSIMSKQSQDKILHLYREMAIVQENNQKQYPDDGDVFDYLLGRVALTLLKTTASTSDYKTFLEVFRRMNCQNELSRMREFHNKQWKILAIAARIHPSAFYNLVKIREKLVANG